MNVTDNFVNSIFSFSKKQYSDKETIAVKSSIADYVAVCQSGGVLMKSKTEQLLQRNQKGSGKFPLFAHGKKVSQYNAILINSLDAHAAELDDGVRYANLHPGISILTALLTLGEHFQLSADDIIRGTLVGYEAAIRIASAIQPSHRNMGHHATGTCGVFGVALGLCSALSLTEQAFKVALTGAASGSAGMLNIMKDQSDMKAYNNSLAVFGGINATLLATSGFHGSDDVLNGKWGFLGMKSREVDYSKLEGDTFGKPLIHDVYRKQYASCRHCHPAIEAALVCQKKHNFLPKDIDKIEVYTYYLAVDGHDSIDIKSVGAAKMSTPYSISVALLYGDVGLSEFENTVINSICVQELLSKVRVIEDKDFSKLVPHQRPARIVIKMKNRSVFEHTVNLAKGEPEVPLTTKEIKQKFYNLFSYNSRTEKETTEIWNAIYNLEDDVNTFYQLISKNRHNESK